MQNRIRTDGKNKIFYKKCLMFTQSSQLCVKQELSELNTCKGYSVKVASDGCAKENPVRIRNDAVTVYGSCFRSHWETGKGRAVMIKVRRTALTWNFRTAVHSACILITKRCYFCNDPEIAQLWELGSCIYAAAFLCRFSAADPCSILAEIQKKKRIRK